VRLAVVKTLASFMTVPTLPRDWIAAPFLRLLFQNLIAEERADIRDASLAAWRIALTVLAEKPGWIDSVVTQQLILEWYAIMMTPLGVAIDPAAFYRPSVTNVGDAAPERHNVDKNMLAQDPSLITNEVTLKARVAAATSLAQLIVFWPANVSALLNHPFPACLHRSRPNQSRSCSSPS
jgi:TATA-binding protein-associated factor